MYRLVYKNGKYVIGTNGKPLEFTEKRKAENYKYNWNSKFVDNPDNEIQIREEQQYDKLSNFRR